MSGQPVWRRLVTYARPFQKRIWLALLLLVLGTSAELAGPFLAKVAIDDHILGVQKNWYQVDAVEPGEKSVTIGNRVFVREDWLAEQPSSKQTSGTARQIVTEGNRYYLLDKVIPLYGTKRIEELGKAPDGQEMYRVVVVQGGQTEESVAVRLTAREVALLYAYEYVPLLWLMGGYALLILLSAVLNYVQLLSLQTTAQRIIQQMRIDLFTHLQKLAVSFFDRTPVGSLVSRVTNDTEAIRELYVSVLATFVQNGVFLIGILIALFILQPSLALICCAILPFLGALVYVYRRYSSRVYTVIRSRVSDMNASIHEIIQNMAVVQAFRREQDVEAEFAKVNEEYFKSKCKENHLQALLLRPAVDFLSVLATTLIIWYFGSKSLHDVISFGVLYAFIDYMGRFFEPVNMIMSRLSQLQQAVTSSGRVFDLLDTPVMEKQEKTAISRPTGRVVFENVWFAYNDDQYVLKDVSFVAEPGQTIALVGHTGSGKSSLMNLLLGFYEHNRGRISIDGVDMKEIDEESLRKHVGLVMQDPFLFTGDVAFNIRLYAESITDEDIEAAARAVKAAEFIERLPDGYREKVAEKGATFSAGQRQLISFARALAADPAILILDEATASIDSETETAIQEALHVLSKGRTTFVIAHRLSTIQHADAILVLSRGEIVERGTHEELMARQGVYHKMYILQQGKVSQPS